MGRNAPSGACVGFGQDAVTMLGGPERQVFGWVMFRPKKLDFIQVNRMEKKDVCTDEGCAGGRRQPTTGRYGDHWSKAGWSSLACGAD